MSAADFPSFYLQRAAREFAEDLDNARLADDFKADGSVQFLVHALQQGSGMYSEAERERVMTAMSQKDEKDEDEDMNDAPVDKEEGGEVTSNKKEKKDKKKKNKEKRRSEGAA